MMDIEFPIELTDSIFDDFLKDFMGLGFIPEKNHQKTRFHAVVDVEFNEKSKEMILVLRNQTLSS